MSRVLVTVGFGALIGATAMTYQLVTGHSFTQVLFSGQDALPALVENAADYSVGALVMLAACKMLAYGLSLSAFRGGRSFPAMFVGAAVGMALSGLPGLSMAPAIAAGIGAMCAAMLRLPMTSALLAALLLGSDGVAVTPQVVVAVAVSFVFTMVLPAPGPKEEEAPGWNGDIRVAVPVSSSRDVQEPPAVFRCSSAAGLRPSVSSLPATWAAARRV